MFVMPLWQPQYLNRAFKLRILEEPQQFLGGPNTAYLIANRDFAAKLTKRQRAMLGRIELSLKGVTEMDYWVNVEKMTPREAARRWIGTNPTTVTYWIEGTEE
jgi:glycine betaine/proline transport system substrate-binding protein